MSGPRFTGKVALITGGANGIGRATVELMAREGARVVAVDTNRERLDALEADTAQMAGDVLGRVCDVLNEDAVNTLVAEVAAEFGRIDILVNIVGGSTIIANPAAHIDELSLADWRKILDFNLEGTFLFCHAVSKLMKAQGSGKIVNLSSTAGRGLAPKSSTAYATAKGGIVILTKKMADELGPYGITVNAIAPGVTLTERVRPFWDRRTDDERDRDLKATALGRMAEPEDQAKVIGFLASSDADFVTGVTIDVNGGL